MSNVGSHLSSWRRRKLPGFEIVPLVSAGGIAFGSTVEEVRNHFRSPFRSFQRVHGVGHPSDHFGTFGAFAYYDAAGHLTAMEFTAREARVLLDGIDLASLTLGEALLHFASQQPRHHDGLEVRALQIGFWFPDEKEHGDLARCETVLAGAPGYYG